MCFYEVLVPDETCDIQVLLDGVEVRGKRGWILNKCVILNESLNPIIYMKGDPTNKSVHPFTFRFFPFMTINSVLQAHVRPLAGGIMENDALLSSTNTHLVMGFQIPEGFSVWIGNPRDIGILDGALLYCHVMFKLGTGWTHMKVVRYYVARKNGMFDYRVQHIATKMCRILFSKRKSMGMVLMQSCRHGACCVLYCKVNKLTPPEIQTEIQKGGHYYVHICSHYYGYFT